MKFVWDDTKNESNKKDHKVSFEQATRVFYDPTHVERYDKGHSAGTETRYTAVGFAKDYLALFVSFTVIDDETIRIISARKAENYEVEDYYGNG